MKKIFLLLAILLAIQWCAQAQQVGGVGINATTLQPQKVASLPTGVTVGTVVPVSNGSSSTDCTTGGGTTGVACIWGGSSWSSIGSGGSSGWPVTTSVHVQSGGTITIDSGGTLSCAAGSTCPPSSGSTTVNGQTCTLASSCTIPLSAINPQTSTYQVLAADFSNYKTITVASGTFNITLVASGSQPANGQYINIVNYGSGVVTVVRSGQNINGGTASLTVAAGSATAPTSATVWSDGSNYFASLPGSGGGISGLTTNYIPKATSSTAIGNSLADDGATTSNTFTYSGTGGGAFSGGPVSAGASPPACSGGTAGVWCGNEGSAPSAVSATDQLIADSTLHDFGVQANGGVEKLLGSTIGYNSGSISASVGATNVATSANFPTGQYLLACDVAVTAVGSSPTLAITIGWTDISGTSRTKTCTTGVVSVSDNPVVTTITSNGSAAITVTQTLAVSTATWQTTVGLMRLQ